MGCIDVVGVVSNQSIATTVRLRCVGHGGSRRGLHGVGCMVCAIQYQRYNRVTAINHRCMDAAFVYINQYRRRVSINVPLSNTILSRASGTYHINTVVVAASS